MAELKIMGSGSFNAGDEYYEQVVISGSGKITGDLKCKDIKISGTGKIEGNIDSDGDIKTSGTGSLNGNVRAKYITIAGSSKFGGNVKCDSFRISGTCKVAGDVDCRSLKIAGAAVLENVSASEEAIINGAANISGLLNAESVAVHLDGDSNVEEIGCTKLYVSRRRDEDGEFKVKIFNFTLFSMSRDGKGVLTAETIEGDDIHIEYTKAEVVRGAKVVIGQGCEIGRVEYTDTLEISEGAAVKEQVKL